jgi:hypothetical protein
MHSRTRSDKTINISFFTLSKRRIDVFFYGYNGVSLEPL